jgi:hypothetical protein
MQYPENFLKVIDLNTFIGTGNPNSKILIVGKEVATDPENGKAVFLLVLTASKKRKNKGITSVPSNPRHKCRVALQRPCF